MQKHKLSKQKGKLDKTKTCPDAEEQINRVKDKSESGEGKQLTVQHIWEMYSPGPSEVI